MKKVVAVKNILYVALCFGLAGCEPLRADLADLLSPPSDAQMAARMGDMAKSGKSSEAVQSGEKFLNSNHNENSSVHAKLAELYLENGRPAEALPHLEKSIGIKMERPGAINGQVHQVFSSVLAPDAPTPPSASAQVGSNGVEAVAGNAKASFKPELKN